MPDKVIPFAVIGSGPVAEHHLSVLQANGDTPPVGIFTRNHDRGRFLADRFRIRLFDSLEELLADHQVLAVDICNANIDHFRTAQAALSGGKHTLVEKPVALKTSEIAELIQLAASRNLTACAVFQKRFNRTTCMARNLIEDGLDGVLCSHSFVHMPRGHGYYRRPEKASWEVAGGGVLIYQAIHDLDLLIQLFGAVKEIVGFRENFYHDTEVEDTCLMLLKFGNGPVAYLQASTAPYFSPTAIHVVYGKSRFLVFDNQRIGVYSRRYSHSWPVFWKISSWADRLRRGIGKLTGKASLGAGTYSDVLRDFLAGILEPSVKPKTSIETTLETHRVIEAFYQGSRASR